MSEEDLKLFKKHLHEIAEISDSFSSIISTVKIIASAAVIAITLCISSVLWVNAKAQSITKLEEQNVKNEIANSSYLKEMNDWKIEIEKILAGLNANQARMIQIQNQQSEIIARHLDSK